MLTTIARERLARLTAAKNQSTTSRLIDSIAAVSPELEAPHHLAPYCAALETFRDAPLRLVFAAPPQHGKTETTLHGLCWVALRYPGLRHVYVTYNQERAEYVSRKFQAIAERANLEPRGTLSDVRLAGGTEVRFTSVCGSITGFAVDGLMLVDDPIKDRQEADSPRRRQIVADWFFEAAMSRRHAKTSIVVMATRWHPEDLSGILVKQRGFRYINLKAIAEGDTDAAGLVVDDPLGRMVGEALWPSHKPVEFFREDRLDIYRWSALWQGEPRPRGGVVFREPGRYQELPKNAYRVAFGVDLAYTAKTHADHSVLIELWREDTNDPKRPRFYVVDVRRAQVDAPSFTLTLKARYAERKAPMRWYASGTEKGAADFIKRQGIPLDVRPPKGDKLIRSQGVAAAWNDGRVLVPDTEFVSAPWLPTFLDEILNFTGVADLHDDQVDALAAGFDALNGPSDFKAILVKRQGW